MGIDQSPLEAEVGDRAFQFPGRRLGALGGQGREPGEGRAGNPANRLGWSRIVSAIRSFTAAALATATVGSDSAWMPGEFSDRTCTSRPAAASRSLVTSSSLRDTSAHVSGEVIVAVLAP